MYEGLVSYFLPSGILEYFEVTDFAEVSTMDKDVLYTTELHIYLDERDNRTPDMKAAISDGFVDESCLLDFPVRDKKTVLHVRRRRWTMPDGITKSVDLDKKIHLKHPSPVPALALVSRSRPSRINVMITPTASKYTCRNSSGRRPGAKVTTRL